MRIKDLKEKLEEMGVSADAYSLTGASCDECYVITNDGPGKWSVFYSERGQRTSLLEFSSESEACEELLRRLGIDPTVLVE